MEFKTDNYRFRGHCITFFVISRSVSYNNNNNNNNNNNKKKKKKKKKKKILIIIIIIIIIIIRNLYSAKTINNIQKPFT